MSIDLVTTIKNMLKESGLSIIKTPKGAMGKIQNGKIEYTIVEFKNVYDKKHFYLTCHHFMKHPPFNDEVAEIELSKRFNTLTIDSSVSNNRDPKITFRTLENDQNFKIFIDGISWIIKQAKGV